MDGITGSSAGFPERGRGLRSSEILIALWVLIGIKNLARVNVVA